MPSESLDPRTFRLLVQRIRENHEQLFQYDAEERQLVPYIWYVTHIQSMNLVHY